MATNETEPRQPQRSAASEAAPQLSEPAPAPIQAPAPVQAPSQEPTQQPPIAVESNAAERLRAEYADIAALAAQAARLGVTVDAADAMAKGVLVNDLRRSVLDALAARADATSVIAAVPSTPAAGDSPIVRRAKERAQERVQERAAAARA